MARSVWSDLLGTHRFWLVDVVPSATWPFYVLGAPLAGFASITAPEVTLEVDPVAQVNSMWPTPIYTGASCGPITLIRGCRAYDDSFWQWCKRAIQGVDVVPRDLLLIQYGGVGTHLPGDPGFPAPPAPWQALGFFPARAWVLWSCIPSRYKAAGDFDASAAGVSMMEIDLQPHAFTELCTPVEVILAQDLAARA
jgi:phage tail-like protein